MTLILLRYTFIFISGAIVGWCIEFFWRRFFDETKRWGNPGFLNGPWLPVYGFGTVILFQISKLGISILYLPIIFLVTLTILEFLAGIVFINFFNIRLWDYRKNRFNIKGIICPLYSLFWGILGTFFNLVIYPLLIRYLNRILQNLELSFFVGFFFGFFILDMVVSFNLAGRIKKLVQEAEGIINLDYERFKLELRDRFEKGVKNRTLFLLPFNGEVGSTLKSRVLEHRNRIIKTIKRK